MKTPTPSLRSVEEKYHTALVAMEAVTSTLAGSLGVLREALDSEHPVSATGEPMRFGAFRDLPGVLVRSAPRPAAPPARDDAERTWLVADGWSHPAGDKQTSEGGHIPTSAEEPMHDQYSFERALRRKDIPSPETFWASPNLALALLPVMSFVYVHALFEAFLQEALLLARARLSPAQTASTENARSLPSDRGPGFGGAVQQLVKLCGLRLDPEFEPVFRDFAAARNLWVHHGGAVNATYLSGSNPWRLKLGELRAVSEDDVQHVVSVFPIIGVDILNALRRTLPPDSADDV